MKSLIRGLLLAGIFFSATASIAQVAPAVQQSPAPPASGPSGWHIVATQELAATVAIGKTAERVTGRMSVYLRASPATLREGYVEAAGVNVLFTGVPQAPLGLRVSDQNALGMLGFALAPGKKQRLRYDAKTGLISGELRMFMDSSAFNALAPRATDGRDDVVVTPTVPVTAAVEFNLGGPLSDRIDEASKAVGQVNLVIKGERYAQEKIDIPSLKLSLIKPAVFDWKIAPVLRFEIAQRLCIQPVRLERDLRFGWFHLTFYSGQGLAFGEPQLRHEWRKVDITFDVRDWKSIDSNSYWELSPTNAGNLRAEVDDDDCIEVFFVNSLNPDATWGGGATWGLGVASSKVITSDDNARGGIDFTHLAHEIGHVLGLDHPPGNSSTGTLMCPSGYHNDNPHVNSQENGDNASNPLLTFALKVISAGPDCTDSADCGACP